MTDARFYMQDEDRADVSNLAKLEAAEAVLLRVRFGPFSNHHRDLGKVLIGVNELANALSDRIGKRKARAERRAEKRSLITGKEAAEILNVCRATIRRYAKRGILNEHRLTARQVRFDREEVERLANGNT